MIDIYILDFYQILYQIKETFSSVKCKIIQNTEENIVHTAVFSVPCKESFMAKFVLQMSTIGNLIFIVMGNTSSVELFSKEKTVYNVPLYNQKEAEKEFLKIVEYFD